MKNQKQKNLIVLITVILTIGVCCIAGYFFLKEKEPSQDPNIPIEEVQTYTEAKDSTDYMKTIYAELMSAVDAKDEQKIKEGVAKYFVTDFFTWSNKEGREDVGGLPYVLPDARVDFAKYATNYYYVNFDEHMITYEQKGLPEVELCEVTEVNESSFVYEKTGNSDSYDVHLVLTYVIKENGMPVDELMTNITVTLLKEQETYYVVGVDYEEISAKVED